jgi:glucuronokinase
MVVKERAYGRVGLLGNPSDIYGGKVIGFTINKYASVSVGEGDELKISGNGGIEVGNLNYNGNHNLVKATIKTLGKEQLLSNADFSIEYESNIPLGSGLAGSSAICVATLRALNRWFNLNLDRAQIAELALRTEVDELNIAAGFQDRYAISFEGVNYMDFSGKEFMRIGDSPAIIERLDVREIPFFLALGVQPKSSAIVHNPLRQRFLYGSEYERKEIKEGMDRIAALAEQGKDYLTRGKWEDVGALMNMNTDFRQELNPHMKGDLEMIAAARELGALGAKVAGSGGAVVVLSDRKEVLDRMTESYPCFKPSITGV